MTDTDDIPIEDIRRTLGMSRVEFIDLLNDDSSGNRLVTSMEAEFRDHLDDCELRGARETKYFSGFLLPTLTVERADWERWQQRNKDAQEQEKWKKSLHVVDNGFDFLKKIFSEQSQKIEELSKELREKNSHITALEQQVRSMQKYGTTGCDGCAHLSRICSMRREGMPDEHIAVFLYDEGRWCSYAQVGALLHPDGNHVAQDSMGQRARRLLGKI